MSTATCARRLGRLERAALPPRGGGEPPARVWIPWNGRDKAPPPVAGQLAAGRAQIVYRTDDPLAPYARAPEAA